MTTRAVLAVFLLILPAASSGWDGPARSFQRKKEKPEITQVLDVPKDPPSVVTADASRLSFYVTPLSNKGLLSQQVRDSLKALWRSAKRAQIVKIRAFVAGSGDLRRIPAIVSEEFTEKRLPLPAVTAVQVGALPLEGAQVLLEAVAVERQPVNAHGLAFISGQPSTVKEAAGALRKASETAGVAAEEVRRVTCFVHSLEEASALQGDMATQFPRAASSVVQLRRDSVGEFAECEAVGALRSPPPASPHFTATLENRYSQVAAVGPVKLAFTGVQLAFGREDADVKLAFQRLGRTLEEGRTSYGSVVMSHVYPLTNSMAEKFRKERLQYYNGAKPPASTLLVFEGLSSVDATFGMDVVAVVP